MTERTAEQNAEQKRLAALFEEVAPPREDQRYSVGHMCVMMEISPHQLRVLMDEADVKFRYLVDQVLYVDGNDLQEIINVFNQVQAEISEAKAAGDAAQYN